MNQTINLGTAYANQTVRIRFRIGEDVFLGAPGWDLDNFVFNGLTNAPFTEIFVDPACNEFSSTELSYSRTEPSTLKAHQQERVSE